MEQSASSSLEAVSASTTYSSEFDFLSKLGQGSYGKVYAVKKNYGNDKGNVYAMKVIRKRNGLKLDCAVIERNVMVSLDNHFITKLMYAFQTDDALYLAMEYLAGGDLECILKSGKLAENDASFYMKELVVAVEYLHSVDVIHRDIKPSNILIDKAGHIKLADFGYAKLNFKNDHETYSHCGALAYIAPEVIHQMGHGRPADWWSVGVVFFKMVVGHLPFYDEDPVVMEEKITGIEYILPNFVSLFADYLISDLLTERSFRIGCNGTDIKKHPFFGCCSDLDWENVYNHCFQEPPYVPKNDNCNDEGPVSYELTSNTVTNSDERFENFDYVNPSI